MTEDRHLAKASREKLKIVVAGHVDHGKSTVIGRLLYDTNSVNLGLVEKVKRISAETGHPFEFAFLLDAFEEERKQGITIDTTQLQFRAALRDYVIIDAPGHKEFLKNMISGASDAEAAFLVVDAEKGVEEQSRRHAHMLSLLGVRRLGLLVNKMDLVNYDQKVFLAITAALNEYLASLGLTATIALPLSALLGENVAQPSPHLAWYQGPTLLAALDSLEKVTEEESDLRLPIQDVYKFDDRRVLAGRIESGRARINDRIMISPGNKITTVVSLPAWLERDLKDEGRAGESVGLMVADEFYNRRGEVISLVDNPPLVSDRLKASIFWLGQKPLILKRRYKIKLATAEAEAAVIEIHHLIDSDSLAPIKAEGQVRLNEVAVVELSLSRPLAMDLFASRKATGRFVLQDGYDVVGGGVITWIEDRPPVRTGFSLGALKARCEIFEEYFYHVGEMAVNKIKPPRPHYGVGDPVPLVGRSYRYPESFDIVVFRDQVAIQIRNGQVANILPLAEFVYGQLPLVNGRGFGLKIQSNEDWLKARDDLATSNPENESSLAERWLDFNAYRHIPIGGDDFHI
ncbi:MAG: 50S ribosome-binding GTPase [Deltaproteobacteria bacterium]|jgi:sulfate adenylyltransferase large subunit|nr:50S ribosome-binding GTPase [Deltaproteobacteria bacterium]